MEYADTFFLDPNEALKVAQQYNKRDRYTLQVCYYDGVIPEHNLPNLIKVSLDNLIDELALGIHRLPTAINFDGLELSSSVQASIIENFIFSVKQAQIIRNELNKHYLDTLRNVKLDFSEPLRFYLMASAYTQVMQFISKNIADTLKMMGYDVLFHLDYGTLDPYCNKLLKEFNPHVTININHLNNTMISDDVFNIIWIQDHFALNRIDSSRIRKRDNLFHLVKNLGHRLKNRGIKSTYQPFCINTNIYRIMEDIKKEKKIVFIGTSYIKAFNTVKIKKKDKIVKEIYDDFLSNGFISKEDRIKYINKIGISKAEFSNIMNYVERDMALLYIIRQIITFLPDFCIEVYGWDWDVYDDIAPYYKGVLNYGEDIAKVYNSAQYSLVLGGYVLQQRTLESAASGCIPIILDPRKNSADEDSECFNESLLFMQKPDDIVDLLKENREVNLKCIVEKNSYKSFVDKIVKTIKSEMNLT